MWRASEWSSIPSIKSPLLTDAWWESGLSRGSVMLIPCGVGTLNGGFCGGLEFAGKIPCLPWGHEGLHDWPQSRAWNEVGVQVAMEDGWAAWSAATVGLPTTAGCWNEVFSFYCGGCAASLPLFPTLASQIFTDSVHALLVFWVRILLKGFSFNPLKL